MDDTAPLDRVIRINAIGGAVLLGFTFVMLLLALAGVVPFDTQVVVYVVFGLVTGSSWPGDRRHGRMRASDAHGDPGCGVRRTAATHAISLGALGLSRPR